MSETQQPDRFTREAEHFDQIYSNQAKTDALLLSDRDKQRYSNPPAGTAFPKEYYYHLLYPLQGKEILEIACGDGVDACLAAYNGAHVYTYDVSLVSVELTQQRAKANGLSDRVHAEVCGELDEVFRGKQFDAVIGYSALHHIPLPGLADKIRSRLKVGGVAVFSEPVVNSPFLARVRKLIPYRQYEMSDDQEPLNDKVISELSKPFDRLKRREFEFVSRIYPIFRKYRFIVTSLFTIDKFLMKIPFLKRFASGVVFALYRDR